MSRLDDLYVKLTKQPEQMTMEECRELQQLAKVDKSTVGQRTARAETRQGKAVKKMSLEQLEQQLKALQLLQQPPA